ncbi:hypothetical protein GUJ93_ZPchr0006g46057 [Zizania palustris]|uniref:Uncharacterized protein n=1 Tax=Zizania palustris TaxID=103762 RepID=A0A8J5W1X4_ZIZPA|nr:hypothetical protein GUJ93_ZPchr0006g46057 [Zizania palustris]
MPLAAPPPHGGQRTRPLRLAVAAHPSIHPSTTARADSPPPPALALADWLISRQRPRPWLPVARRSTHVSPGSAHGDSPRPQRREGRWTFRRPTGALLPHPWTRAQVVVPPLAAARSHPPV